MTDVRRLALVRALHTAIYLVMATAAFVVLYAGITGAHGPWLWVAAALVLIESAVFAASGLKCPLTAVAVRYGAGQDGLFDTFLPERITRHTCQVFGPLIAVAFALLAARGVVGAWR
ncbi:MAG: hypothetical protein ABW360_06065 [Phenylobacterium sp.]